MSFLVKKYGLRLACLCFGLSGAWLAHKNHRAVDDNRFVGQKLDERYFLPSPQVTRAISLGHHSMLSDFFWIRTILLYSEFATECTPEKSRWLKAMIRNSVFLDPMWRTLYFYGGSMLQVCEDYEASEEIFLLGHENIPDDSYFPFSVAANASMYLNDYDKALHWMEVAVKIPNAPPWYQGTLATLVKDKSGLSASILYVESQLEIQKDPLYVEALKGRLRLLHHEQRAMMLEKKREDFQNKNGRDIVSIQELGPLVDDAGNSIEDPFNNITDAKTGQRITSRWILAPDGVIRALVMDMQQARKDLMAERRLMKWKEQTK